MMSRDNVLVIFFSSILIVGLVGLLLRQPIQGVDREVSFSYQNENFTLNLKNQVLLERKYTGTFDVMKEEVIIATEDKSVWDFMRTCSHELSHAEDFSRKHSEMPDFSMPWNWKSRCFNLLKYRF